jgi:hypothetical protein
LANFSVRFVYFDNKSGLHCQNSETNSTSKSTRCSCFFFRLVYLIVFFTLPNGIYLIFVVANINISNTMTIRLTFLWLLEKVCVSCSLKKDRNNTFISINNTNDTVTTYIYIHTYLCIQIYTYLSIYTYIRAYLYIHIYIHIHTYIYIYIYTYIYIHTYL